MVSAMADMVLYHHPGCSTCRKARKWLDGRDVNYRLVDIVENPPSQNALKDLHARAGVPLAKLFNTSGVSYREGGFKDRLKNMTDAQARAALAADGKLIKRPILSGGGVVLVGFREEAYRAQFG